MALMLRRVLHIALFTPYCRDYAGQELHLTERCSPPFLEPAPIRRSLRLKAR